MAKQRQIPGGPLVVQTDTKQRQVPGFGLVVETETVGGGAFKPAWANQARRLIGASMYPRNAASPPRIAIGPVVQISDGAVQTAGCTVRVLEQGGAEGDGGGTTAYSTDGIVLYTPTQAETDQSAFILIAKKTGCIPAAITVNTSASGVAGYAGLDWSTINSPTSTVGLTNTTIGTVTTTTTATNVTTVNGLAANVITAASINASALDGKGNWNIGKTGYSLTATTGLGNQTADITGNLSGSVGSVTGAVGSVTGAVGSVTGNVTGSIGSLAAQAKADVNAEVLDVFNTDTFAEPGQEAPGATVSLVKKIGYLYKAWRNKSTQTATTYSLFGDDATTVDQKATVSDDGTTATRGEVTTGP